VRGISLSKNKEVPIDDKGVLNGILFSWKLKDVYYKTASYKIMLLTINILNDYNINTEEKHLVFLSGMC
jgi:hypothetical protein